MRVSLEAFWGVGIPATVFLWSTLTPPRQVTEPRLGQGFFIPGDMLYCLRYVRRRSTVSISSTVPNLRIQHIHVLALQFPVVNRQDKDLNKSPKSDVLHLACDSLIHTDFSTNQLHNVFLFRRHSYN